MNYIIFSYLLIGLHIQIIKSNEIFPTIPGSETGITPIHSTGYFIQFSQKNKNMKDMFSNTISVTSNYTFHILLNVILIVKFNLKILLKKNIVLLMFVNVILLMKNLHLVIIKGKKRKILFLDFFYKKIMIII